MNPFEQLPADYKGDIKELHAINKAAIEEVIKEFGNRRTTREEFMQRLEVVATEKQKALKKGKDDATP